MAVLTDLQEEKATITAPYDVFLSFRGKDTRLTFIDHLYQALVNENICTYLDEDEIETGEDLKPELSRAIRNSRASIIVLSENYASSTWCLDELVMILEQQRTSKHIVLPIFYHVEPTNIRKQQSSFGDALVKHQRRIEAEKDLHKKSQGARKLELWTKALRQVADLKGKDAHGRRETLFIEEIVTEISSRLDLHLRWNIPQLMGRDFSIDSISSWLKEGSRKTVAILTIWGMAGIGKTSLAKYIYRLHYHEFERSSFVEDIERRCAQQSSALLDLQKQLLGDLLKKSMIEVHDVNVYTAKIEKALLNKRTLVVLDGIDNFEQLDVLVGTKHFHPGSKIIVTTKDRSLTEKCALFRTTSPPKHTKHKLDCLSDTESLRLLCWHAVGGHGPKEGYEEETKKFAKYCGGHPLALKVLGRSLLNEDVATWSETFEMLEKEEMCTDIEKVLRISFDSLPSENCKELFKHIACFFVGKDWGSTETILKECGIRTSVGIMKLVDRGLLMVGPQNRLMMHQLLQEMGRDLVRQESPEKPWKRSRLWNHEESLSVLKEEKGTKKIQGLVLDMRMLEKRRSHGTSSLIEKKFHDDSDKYFRAIPLIHRAYDILSRIWRFFSWLFLLFSSSPGQEMGLRTKAFCKMDKLHLLQLDYVKLNGSYKNFPKGLKSLSMRGFPSKYIPSDLPMEKLVALDMSRSNLKRAWKNFKILGSLKILNLSHCKLLIVVHFSRLPALEQLILAGCTSLIQVCESVGQCDKLVLLDVSNCQKLRRLPRSIGKLNKLRYLYLDGCVDVNEFLAEMKLEVLRVNGINRKLHASTSSIVEPIPRSPNSLLLSLPQSIVSLSLAGNNLSNGSFPTDMSRLSMLKHLHLGENPIDSLPNCVRSLKKLEVLSLEGCDMLKSVLFPPSTIKRLYAGDCSSLVKIHFHQEISTPPHVHYNSSESLNEVQGIMKIQAISQIDEEMLCSLGWKNLEYPKNQELQIWDSYIWNRPKKLPIQMYYEFGIFSTCFPGKEVPNWLAHTSMGSSISFTIPSSPKNQSIQGLNVCFVHAFSGIGKVGSSRTKIRNITKNQTWIHYAYIFAVKEGNEEGIVWLSHWMFGNNEFEDGDEVSVTIVEEEEDCGVVVRECGAGPVYFGDKEEDPLDYYKSWKHIIGGDLSAFQLTSGDYFLTHDRFIHDPDEFKELFQHRTTQNLLGYTPRYKQDEATQATGILPIDMLFFSAE